MTTAAIDEIDPLFLARSRLRRRKYDKCVETCTELLAKSPYDLAVWWIKARAMTLDSWIDDSEMEEEGVAELLLDENAVAQAPRPGTSLSDMRPGGGINQAVRPVSSAGRPLTGFARPGTGSRPGTGAMSLSQAFRGSRPGTARAATSLGRCARARGGHRPAQRHQPPPRRRVRLGTASLAAGGASFVDVDKMDLKKYARRPALSRVLCDYLLYHERNPVKALELAAYATVFEKYEDWWWKARLGKCYYQLGLLRDAEKQFKSSLRDQSMVVTSQELCKVYIKLDQPKTAMEWYQRASEAHPSNPQLLLGIARIYDGLGDMEHGVSVYQRVLELDPSNAEAIACLASNHFYSDQPEIALRYYRRLVQMGVNTTELWNNLGLCCFYASQYDMTLNCFERALQLADDSNMADVWYNIGHLAIGIGDLGLAYQAFKIAISVNSDHAEAYNNLGVLELRKSSRDQARSNFATAQRLADYAFEPFYNAALLAYKMGDFQESFMLVQKALVAYPNHTESKELAKLLRAAFDSV